MPSIILGFVVISLMLSLVRIFSYKWETLQTYYDQWIVYEYLAAGLIIVFTFCLAIRDNEGFIFVGTLFGSWLLGLSILIYLPRYIRNRFDLK